MFKVNNKNIRTTSLVSLLLTLNIFYTFFSGVFIADLEQVNVSWDLGLTQEQKPKEIPYKEFSIITLNEARK